jgi:hypothetical protein
MLRARIVAHDLEAAYGKRGASGYTAARMKIAKPQVVFSPTARFVRLVAHSSYGLAGMICQIGKGEERSPACCASLGIESRGADMDADGETQQAETPDVPLVPAAAVGFLLYPWAVQLILANPPANDAGQPPAPR